MGVISALRLRIRRKRLLWRGFFRRRDLVAVKDRTNTINRGDILLFSTIRNERTRLPYFLDYYRKLGVQRFMIVDNASDDGSREYLAAQADVSLWTTRASYKRARFGSDWVQWLQWRYATGHWCLVVDCDEFLVYPFCDTRPLRALTDWLDASSVKSFGAVVLDMYPKGPIIATAHAEGQDPFRTANYFDGGNYTIIRNPVYGNLWIQGGPRARTMFASQPETAPALNKVPLVKWRRGYAYVSSTHMMLPRGLNLVYDEWGGEKASGCLLHAKFDGGFSARATEELVRQQHYADSLEYRAYLKSDGVDTNLWCKWSEAYLNWRQLEILGLMSKGNWA